MNNNSILYICQNRLKSIYYIYYSLSFPFYKAFIKYSTSYTFSILYSFTHLPQTTYLNYPYYTPFNLYSQILHLFYQYHYILLKNAPYTSPNISHRNISSPSISLFLYYFLLFFYNITNNTIYHSYFFLFTFTIFI